VTGTIDGRPFSILGSLAWVPTKNQTSYLWVSYIAIAVGVLAAATLLLRRRATVRRPQPAQTP